MLGMGISEIPSGIILVAIGYRGHVFTCHGIPHCIASPLIPPGTTYVAQRNVNLEYYSIATTIIWLFQTQQL